MDSAATDARFNEQVEEARRKLDALRAQVHRVIVGQDDLLDRLLIGLLCGGHVLLEGVPGLAKTLCVTTLARALDAGFKRIQFTPDLLPADLIGTQIYNPRTSEFSVHKGPIFANLILADEINRAPAKVQSALLEAMQERQVTIGENTYPLDEPFLVMATQNPIEQEGTYPLPEAQIDRFMLKIRITYPSKTEEKAILERMGKYIGLSPYGHRLGFGKFNVAMLAVGGSDAADQQVGPLVSDLPAAGVWVPGGQSAGVTP